MSTFTCRALIGTMDINAIGLCESCERNNIEVVILVEKKLFMVCRECAAIAKEEGVSIREAIIHACHR